MIEKTIIMWLLLVCITFACVSCTHTTKHFDPAKLTPREKICYDAINASYVREEAAVARKDIEGVMANSSPDIDVTLPSGKVVDYAQGRQEIVKMFSMSKQVHEENEIQDLRIVGNTVVVTNKSHLEATLIIPNLLTGQPIKRETTSIHKETWEVHSQVWLITKMDYTRNSQSL